MPRYDKYDPKNGGFRAPLAADWAVADLGKVFGVGLNALGQIVKGAGVSGIKGVLILTIRKFAGDIVDSMTSGEIVEMRTSDSSATAGTPGTSYYADKTTGEVTTTNTGVYVGCTVEGGRLVTRVDVTKGA